MKNMDTHVFGLVLKVAILPNYHRVWGFIFVFNDPLHQTLISNSLFLKKWDHPSNSNFASSISMITSKKTTLAFENNCFCFQVTALFYQKKVNFHSKCL